MSLHDIRKIISLNRFLRYPGNGEPSPAKWQSCHKNTRGTKNKCVVDISVGRSCSTGVRGVLLSERCEECYHLKTLNDPDSQKLTYPESLISLTLPTDFRPPQDLDSYYPSLTHTGPFCINHLPSFDYHVKFPRCDSSNPFCVQNILAFRKY